MTASSFPTNIVEQSKISLRELELFIEVSKNHSIRETSRRFRMEPSQVSRQLKRLEEKLGTRLLERTALGVSLTQQGSLALEKAQLILKEADELYSLSNENAKGHQRIFGIGSSAFLCTKLVAPVVGQLSREDSSLRMRLLDVAPDQIISLALRGAYDMALHIGNLDWPRSWVAKEVGVIEWKLFASKKLKLAKTCSVQAIKEIPFVTPVYWTQEGLLEGNDQCPLRLNQRVRGLATATAESAMAVVKASEQLGFLPEIIAREAVDAGELVSIDVREWKPVTKKLFLAARSDIVPQKLYERLLLQLRKLV